MSVKRTSVYIGLILYLLLLIPSNEAYGYQNLLVDRNWSYFWGDFDIEDQEQIPQDIMARIEASPWEPLQGTDGLAQPPGRNGRHLLWLKVDLPQRELRDPVLFADFFFYACEVYQGNRRIYSHHRIGDPGSGRFDGIQAVIIPLLEDRLTSPIYFRLYSTDPLYIGIDELFFGDRMAFYTALVRRELPSLLMGFFFIVLGIIPLFPVSSEKNDQANRYFSLFLISLGIWTLNSGYLVELWTGPSLFFYGLFQLSEFSAMIGLLLYFDVLWPESPWSRWLKIIRRAILFLLLPGFFLAVITRPTFVVFALADDIKIVTRLIVGVVTCMSCIHAAVRKKIPSVVAIAYSLFVISTVYDSLRDTPTFHSWILLLFLLTLAYTNQKRMISYHAGLKESKTLLLESKLETLKAQLQPHFLFNSLNTLSSLIFISRERAAGFIRKFATVYRIILESRGKSTVSLEKEMELANAYLHLIQTRFDGGLSVTVSIDEQLYQKQIVPLSIQLLVENAVKHNIVSKKQPLMISIRTTGAAGIAVKNSLQIKPVSPGSSKMGLKSIKTSYGLLTNIPVSIHQTSENFTVRLPLL